MSEGDSSDSHLDGTVLEDQLQKCDEIMEDIRARPGVVLDSESDSESPVGKADSIYQSLRESSVRGFSDRYQASALYPALKDFLQTLGEERGYEHLMIFTTRLGTDVVTPDIGVYWLKLYTGVVLEIQPQITFERSISHFKDHRDKMVVHTEKVHSGRKGPDPTFVNSVVPLWFALEDILDLWRRVLDKDPDERERREHVLKGEVSPDGGLATYRYGFINKLNHEEDSGKKIGFITDYQNGQDGKGSRFTTEDVDFFPQVGDIVRFQAEQQERYDGTEHGALTVTDTVTLVE